jgi:hypothetical protein
MLNLLKRLFVIKSTEINKEIEIKCKNYCNKIIEIKSSFTKNFFLQIIECGKSGTKSFISYIKISEKQFYKNIKKNQINVILRLICLYHVARFLNETNDVVDKKILLKTAVEIFKFSEKESYNFNNLLEILDKNVSVFEVSFSAYFIESVFTAEIAEKTVLIAAVNNFFYNSYIEFVNNFSSYYIKFDIPETRSYSLQTAN